MIKNILARNKPVFIIGGLTMVVFIVLILVSSRMNHIEPGLVPVTDTGGDMTPYTVVSPKSAVPKGFNDIPSAETEVESSPPSIDPSRIKVSPNMTQEEIDAKFSIVEIRFTNNGFAPKNAKAVQGQLVRWVNETNGMVYIRDIGNVFPEFKDTLVLPAHDEVEFRFYKPVLWSYEDTRTRKIGSVLILSLENPNVNPEQ